MSDKDLKGLQDALAQAKDALAEETGTGGKVFGSEQEELDYLRAREAERREEEQVRGLVQQVAAGVKVDQQAEQSRLEATVSRELARALGGEQATGLVANAVARAAAQRLGRRYVADTAGDTGVGSKGGGTYIPAGRMGDRPSLMSFLRAVGMKDVSTIRDIQTTMGTSGIGGKTLVEGGGAIDSIAGPSGGYLVPVQWGQEIIDALTANVVVRRAGARVLNLTSPVFRQPRLSGRASASYVGETAAIASSQETFEQFSLNCHKLAAIVPISNELLSDSSPAVEMLVTQDLARAIGLKEDSQYLVGTGSSTAPAGLLTLAGINSDTISGGPTYADILGMIFALESANVPEVNRVWIGHPKALQAVAGLVDDDHRPLFAWLDAQSGTLTRRQPTLFGYPFYTTTQMTYNSGAHTASLALVDAGYAVIGQMQGIEIRSSDEATFVDNNNSSISAFQQDLTVFRAIIRADVNVTHPEAIVLRTGMSV